MKPINQQRSILKSDETIWRMVASRWPVAEIGPIRIKSVNWRTFNVSIRFCFLFLLRFSFYYLNLHTVYRTHTHTHTSFPLLFILQNDKSRREKWIKSFKKFKYSFPFHPRNGRYHGIFEVYFVSLFFCMHCGTFENSQKLKINTYFVSFSLKDFIQRMKLHTLFLIRSFSHFFDFAFFFSRLFRIEEENTQFVHTFRLRRQYWWRCSANMRLNSRWKRTLKRNYYFFFPLLFISTMYAWKLKNRMEQKWMKKVKKIIGIVEMLRHNNLKQFYRHPTSNLIFFSSVVLFLFYLNEYLPN